MSEKKKDGLYLRFYKLFQFSYESRGSGGSGGSPPFANARVGSGMSIGIGPWGAYVGMSLGNF